MSKLTVARVNAPERPRQVWRRRDPLPVYQPGWHQKLGAKGHDRGPSMRHWPRCVPGHQPRQGETTGGSQPYVGRRRGATPLAIKRKAATPTFREAAERTFEANKGRWRNAKATANWMQSLERYAFPAIGSIRVDQISREHLLRILTPIWTGKPETGRKVRQRLRAVLSWAQAHGYVEHNLAGDAISGALPTQKAVQAHFRALPYQEVGMALETVEASGAGISARLCFRWVVLTATRSGEARGAKWAEIDRDTREWRIPAERMKSAVDHVVPLSSAAMLVLGRGRETA